MYLLQPINWESVAKLWGPLGIIFVVAILVAVAGAKMYRKMVLGSVENANKMVQSTIEDARSERDYARSQREREATAYITELKNLGDRTREGFDEVLRELRTRRK